MLTQALAALFTLIAVVALLAACVLIVTKDDGRATPLALVSIACYAVVQLLRSVSL